jgi:alkyl sulfatase BDS1-like metallo-beta-lactamase superfamily hydrolase
MTLNRRTSIGAGAAGVASVGLRSVPDLAAHAAGQPAPEAFGPGFHVRQPATPAAEGSLLGKDATSFTRAANAAVLTELDFDNANQLAGIDAVADAERGFIASRPELVVTAEDGREVWNLTAYAFLEQEESPPSVNPSLWRQARLNMHHGLFKVVDGVYQVRGFDLSNMTIVEGDTGIIVIDPLISVEVARAALDLYYEHRPARPVAAVIYTHSHADHFGGVLGVVSEDEVKGGQIEILAPDGFLEAAVSENVLAGSAMSRRSDYMYAPLLPRGEKGQVDAGIGKTRSSGRTTIVPPTDVITRTGERRTIAGVEMEFQLAPDTEAPAEMTIYFPRFRVFDSAELACDTLHNLYTLRGAQVRDAGMWAYYLNEALALYGDKTDVVISQHNWPKWGQEQTVAFLKAQRDMYKYVHDQTLRLMNHGYTANEIAEVLELPAPLREQWFLRGYYGTVSHNVKAVYQKYLGWYDANPASLNPFPSAEAAAKYVAYMGGADAVLTRARADFEQGDYRWVAEVMNRVVFADPENEAARHLQADALEQLGYQAEAATWRNAYLMGAYELRNGVLSQPGPERASPSALKAMTMPMIFDFLGVRLDGTKAENRHIVLNWNLTDTGEKYVLNLEHSALTYLPCPPAAQPADADATVTLARATLNAVLAGETTLRQAIVSGAAAVEGNAMKIAELFDLLDTFGTPFNIVTP